MGAIPQCFGNMSGHLEVLDMQHNNISGTPPTTLKIGSALRSFNLHGNKLEGKIPPSLENCQHLEVVDLGDNLLNDTFPVWLGTPPELRVLSLRLNLGVTGSLGPSWFGIPIASKASGQVVTECFSLLYLFTITFASTEEATALLKWKSTFKNQDNSLLASWHPSSDACNDWYGVSCINGRVNKLNITNASVFRTLYAFPFSSLPFIEYLNLSMNNLSGTIPPEIGNLTNLRTIKLPRRLKGNSTINRAHIVEDDQNNSKKRKKVEHGSNQPKKKFKGKCFNCDKIDHKSTEYQALKKGKKKYQEIMLESNKERNDLCAMFSECNLVGNPREWWMDSGDTRHVCANKELFSSFALAQAEEMIYMANSATAKVEGTGKICLKMTSDKVLILNNVLYVPELRRNLIFVSLLDKIGFKYVTVSEKF
ncbi:hypothetical protein T459_31581 [Capsicum annuum]|uniref:Uncharacterized protein n=1 Tax=Capsicum annuum TaxID=4072 RepID=A0A2G2YBM5_CAPAN|nr:hypothetical protein T459_31581 [Capsicum annuum]